MIGARVLSGRVRVLVRGDLLPREDKVSSKNPDHAVFMPARGQRCAE